MSTSLLCEKAYQITHAKANVFSDSVLCARKWRHHIATWKSKITWFWHHDWTGWPHSPLDCTSEKIQRVLKINASTKSLVSDLRPKDPCVVRIGYVGSISALDKATLKAEAHAPQCTATGPYNAVPTNLLCVGPCAALVLTWLVFTLSASWPALEVSRVRTRSTKAFRRSSQLQSLTFALVLALSSIWSKRISRHRPWLKAATTLLCDELCAGFCCTDLLTGLQGSGTDRSLSDLQTFCLT